MDTNTSSLRVSLKVLETERVDTIGVLHTLETEVSGKRQRVEDLERAISALRSLLGEPAAGVAPTADSSQSAEAEREFATARQAGTGPGMPTKSVHIRSTDAVVRIVRQAPQPVTRDEIKRTFHEQGLVCPWPWKSPHWWPGEVSIGGQVEVPTLCSSCRT